MCLPKERKEDDFRLICKLLRPLYGLAESGDYRFRNAHRYVTEEAGVQPEVGGRHGAVCSLRK